MRNLRWDLVVLSVEAVLIPIAIAGVGFFLGRKFSWSPYSEGISCSMAVVFAFVLLKILNQKLSESESDQP
ncbi:MAG: hypothetical protein R3A11_08540 [Bdellovibrionota bacterium]